VFFPRRGIFRDIAAPGSLDNSKERMLEAGGVIAQKSSPGASLYAFLRKGPMTALSAHEQAQTSRLRWPSITKGTSTPRSVREKFSLGRASSGRSQPAPCQTRYAKVLT